MVLAPSDLVYEIIPSIEIWELRASPLWRESPPKSQFYDIRLRYGSYVLRLCGESHLQNPYPDILALWRCIIVTQMPLGHFMVLLAFRASY